MWLWVEMSSQTLQQARLGLCKGCRAWGAMLWTDKRAWGIEASPALTVPHWHLIGFRWPQQGVPGCRGQDLCARKGGWLLSGGCEWVCANAGEEI